MPMGGAGAMGGRGGQKDHRNGVFIPSDDPFRVTFTDVTPPVLGLDDGSDDEYYR
jgi:hypothetical protein